MPRAGHVGSPISHPRPRIGAVGGLAAGAQAGATVAVAALVTGDAAWGASTAAGASLAAGGGIGHVLAALSRPGVAITGRVMTGSHNVFVNGRAAAFAHAGTGSRSHDGPSVQTLAQGSNTVFVNGWPFGRVGDKHTGSGRIERGSINVHVGGGTWQTDEIEREVPAWASRTLGALGFASAAISAGPLTAVFAAVVDAPEGESGAGDEAVDTGKGGLLLGSQVGSLLGRNGCDALGRRFAPRPTAIGHATGPSFVRDGAPLP